MTNQMLFDDADVGPYIPPGSSPIQRRGERGVIAGVAVADYETIEQNLEGLTMNILDASIDDVLRHYQCHTVGVSASIGRLLRKVAWQSHVIASNILDALLYMKPCASHFLYFGLRTKTLFCKLLSLYIYEASTGLLVVYTKCDWIL
jgi:hypothetical protein